MCDNHTYIQHTFDFIDMRLNHFAYQHGDVESWHVYIIMFA